MKQRRFWRYSYKKWTPRWWGWIIPQRFHGGDEYGRHTLVMHMPGFGFLTWAYKTCYCGFCIDSRLGYLKRKRELDELNRREANEH